MANYINLQPTDLTYLSWSLSRSSSGTAGSFLKSYEEINEKKYYYKMSNYDSVRGVIGHESVNEIVAENIADLLHMEHLHYELVYCRVKVSDKIFDTWVTKSVDFKQAGESKMTFETYYEILHHDGEDKFGFIERMGLQDYFYQVFLLDYIICNRDRHGANIEVLQKEENYRLAPLFDHGLSFMFSCYNDGEKMLEFDKLKDGPVNNYVGSMNLSDNLKLVPKTFRQKVTMPSRAQLFQGLENAKGAVPEEYWDCIYDMVKERINYVKNI
ncbi:MAG: hypothetical protein MR508_08890 [Lachnospiraceae bacterium]|nr:hypothetical protein [Lachnospiraceae bacterium]